ncbi:MAG: hypothetical protein OXG11_09845 [Chloroflexi bacterium]|nr:hypothetical protein [Chloroflexota bacterium]
MEEVGIPREGDRIANPEAFHGRGTNRFVERAFERRTRDDVGWGAINVDARFVDLGCGEGVLTHEFIAQVF